MKKAFFLTCLLGTAVVALAGCSGGSAYDPDNFLPNGVEGNPYQIVKNPVEISIFAPKGTGNPSFDTLEMFKYLSEITNLKFKFTTPDSSAVQTVRAGVWQNQELPDLFLFANPISEIVQYVEQGFPAYVPLNDSTYSYKAGGKTIEVGNVIDNYMPNYKNGLENNFGVDLTAGNAKKVATLNDGKMYSTLTVKDVARDLTYKMFINQGWIDNLNTNYGLNLPNANEISTLDDYYTVLKAFKDYDANDNGNPNDEIPVTSKSLEYLRNYILQAYGYVSYGPEIRDDWSQYDFVPMTSAYREYLKFASKLYSEGLLHNKTFTISTDAQMATYGQQNLLGSFVAAAPYLITGYELENNYTTIAPVRASSYTGPLHQYCLGYFDATGACIPQKTMYVREVARLLDIMYSDLGTQLISYGVEGKNWHWNDENHTSWTFDVPADWTGNQEQYRGTITPNVGTASALYWSNNFVGKMDDDIIEKLNSQSEIYNQYLKVAEPFEIKLNSTEYATITKIKASLDTQITYLESCFIKKADGYDPYDDTSYNNFITKIKGYDCENLIKCYNDALARYKGAN